MRVAWRTAVADDDPDMRGLIADALRKDGHSVVELEDGAALRREVEGRSDPPLDLIVSDVRMPIVTGLAVLRTLRASGSTLPVILMTAFGDDAVQREAAALRALLFNKPFKVADLRVAVRSLLGSSPG